MASVAAARRDGATMRCPSFRYTTRLHRVNLHRLLLSPLLSPIRTTLSTFTVLLEIICHMTQVLVQWQELCSLWSCKSLRTKGVKSFARAFFLFLNLAESVLSIPQSLLWTTATTSYCLRALLQLALNYVGPKFVRLAAAIIVLDFSMISTVKGLIFYKPHSVIIETAIDPKFWSCMQILP